MTLAGILALLQSAGFLHMLFSTLSVLLPQATKEQPLWFVVRRLIDWAALNVGNAENLPKKGTLSTGDSTNSPSGPVSTLPTLTTPAISPTSDAATLAVTDKQSGDGSDVPKFPN
jgi:hypothetical protein